MGWQSIATSTRSHSLEVRIKMLFFAFEMLMKIFLERTEKRKNRSAVAKPPPSVRLPYSSRHRTLSPHTHTNSCRLQHPPSSTRLLPQHKLPYSRQLNHKPLRLRPSSPRIQPQTTARETDISKQDHELVGPVECEEGDDCAG